MSKKLNRILSELYTTIWSFIVNYKLNSVKFYTHTHTHTHTHTYIYIYIYIYTVLLTVIVPDKKFNNRK